MLRFNALETLGYDNRDRIGYWVRPKPLSPTQLIWKDMSQAGCDCVNDPDGNSYFVCRYVSPGNIIGQAVF